MRTSLRLLLLDTPGDGLAGSSVGLDGFQDLGIEVSGDAVVAGAEHRADLHSLHGPTGNDEGKKQDFLLTSIPTALGPPQPEPQIIDPPTPAARAPGRRAPA